MVHESPFVESMGFSELRAICLGCRHEFVVPTLPDFLYGEKELRTRDGKTLVILCCLQSAAVSEIIEYLRAEFPKESDRAHGKIFDAVVGVCCDPVCNQELDVTNGPRCPSCQSDEVDLYDFDPPRTRVVDVIRPTHHRWNALSWESRRRKIDDRLREGGYMP